MSDDVSSDAQRDLDKRMRELPSNRYRRLTEVGGWLVASGYFFFMCGILATVGVVADGVRRDDADGVLVALSAFGVFFASVATSGIVVAIGYLSKLAVDVATDFSLAVDVILESDDE